MLSIWTGHELFHLAKMKEQEYIIDHAFVCWIPPRADPYDLYYIYGKIVNFSKLKTFILPITK